MTSATEYITSNMSEVIRTFKHSVMKGSLQVFLPPTHSLSHSLSNFAGPRQRLSDVLPRALKTKKISRAGA